MGCEAVPLLTFLWTTVPSSSEWSFTVKTKALQLSKCQELHSITTTQRHESWATLMWELKLYCYHEAKRHPARRYEDWGLSKTMVVAFTLFQRSVYRQVKTIQSHGVWVSPVMNKHSIQEEIKSGLKSGMLAVIRCRIFSLPVCYPKL
jgi:hypothetical protein